jgi:hypothetical protein
VLRLDPSGSASVVTAYVVTSAVSSRLGSGSAYTSLSKSRQAKAEAEQINTVTLLPALTLIAPLPISPSRARISFTPHLLA